MSINSIDHDQMTEMADKWELEDDVRSAKKVGAAKSAEARRRIEMLKEIRDSGLSLEEARELGLIH